MAPPEITIHFSRLPVPSDATTVENLEHLEDHLEDSLQSLVQAKIKAVAFACTSGSFIKGPLWDRHLIERMEKIVSLATTTSESIISALRSLKVMNLSLVTPYPDTINELMEAYLASQGFHVVNLQSLHRSSSSEIKRVQPKTIFEMGKSANTKRAEGVLISCTDLQAIPIIEALEQEIKKPVISSNQATLWKLMILSGIHIPIKGYGRLLRETARRQEAEGG
jgi:maleate isomerase